MKNIRKFIIISFLIFILLAIVITSWYILSLNYLEEYDLGDIIRIFMRIGLVGAIIPSLTISLIYYLIKRIENKLLLSFLMLFLIFQVYWISINLFFYDINSSESFLSSLKESFKS